MHYITQPEQGLPEVDRRYAVLKQSNVLGSFDEPTLLTAARLKAENRISMYECLNNQLEMEALPYK